MTKSVFVLGRQPELGVAELESIFPDVFKVNRYVAGLDDLVEAQLIDRLGGTIKIGTVLEEIDSASWDKVEGFVRNLRPELKPGKSKLDFGISLYGFNVEHAKINKLLFELKNKFKSEGISLRVVPTNAAALTSAQVVHNGLFKDGGYELLVINSQTKTTFAKTVSVQNIKRYAERDQARPSRDASVGMLPPKLAQIMINLSRPKPNQTIIDPFCGTGVILQEALLMGFKVIGGDIDERMVEYASNNLKWLENIYPNLPTHAVKVADATKDSFEPDDSIIVSETYLGKLFINRPSPQQIQEEQEKTNELIKNFLLNLAKQLKTGATLCISVPAWRDNQGFIHLPLLDQIDEIGYNFLSFKTVNPGELIYSRPEQSVARQLLAIRRT